MKKTFSTFLFYILLIYILISFLLPGQFNVQGERLIHFSVDELFEEFKDIKKFTKWYLYKSEPLSSYNGSFLDLNKEDNTYRWIRKKRFYDCDILDAKSNKSIKTRIKSTKGLSQIGWLFSQTKENNTLVGWKYKGEKIPFYLRLFYWIKKEDMAEQIGLSLDCLQRNMNFKIGAKPYHFLYEVVSSKRPSIFIGISQEITLGWEEFQECVEENTSKIHSYLMDYLKYNKEKIGSLAILYNDFDRKLDKKKSFYIGYLIEDQQEFNKLKEKKEGGDGQQEDEIELIKLFDNKHRFIKVDYQGRYEDLDLAYKDLKKERKTPFFSKEVLEIFPWGFQRDSTIKKINIFFPI